jgi:hypothetical protein
MRGAARDVQILPLDTDGVLNTACVELPEGWRRGTLNGYVLSWDPTITPRLRFGWMEIQRLTTWAGNVDRLLPEPMGCRAG